MARLPIPPALIWAGLLASLFVSVASQGSPGDPCSNNVCPTDQICVNATCICTIGFQREGSNCVETPEEFELHPQDGWYNNLLHPNWGGIDGQLLRPSPPAYSDGVFEPSGMDRPNPLAISRTSFNGSSGESSVFGRNAMLTFFGQQVVEEIMDSQRPGCPREFFNVPVPEDHPYREKAPEMPLLRTRYDFNTGYSPSNPRQQLNEITPYIDGTLMYGIAKAWTDTLRSFKDGRLAQLDENQPITNSFPVRNDIRLPFANPPVARTGVLEPVSRFYRLGNPRGFENPFLLTFGVLWVRYHNVIAERIKAAHPNWNDERIFNEARKRVIAQHQKIVMYDWLPIWLQLREDNSTFDIPKYTGYKPHVHPGITQEFQSAALRFGHTLVPAGVFTRTIKDNQCEMVSRSIISDPNKEHTGIRLCQAFWSSQEPLEAGGGVGFEESLLGMAWTKAEKEDHIIVADLRHNLFGPLDFTRRDLGALNIQRARDHGLPGYNTIREVYGLQPLQNYNAINNFTGYQGQLSPIFRQLQDMYGETRPDKLDVFVGGLLETTPEGPGPLFRNITLDAFTRIRDGDRFWFENRNNKLFSEDEITDIFNTDLGDIIALVSNITRDQLPENVFLARERAGALCTPSGPYDETNRTQFDLFEQCGDLTIYDYFSGSEASFALTFVALGLCVFLTIGIMILMAKMRERKMASQRVRKAPKREEDPNKFEATEWVGPESGDRNVKVELQRDRKKIIVHDLTGRTLRLIDLRHTSNKVHIRLADDRGQDLLSIRVPGETDLVLRFGDINERMTSLDKIEKFLQDLGINRERHEFSEKQILTTADHYDQRKKLLDKFFRVILLQAFKKNPSDTGLTAMDADTVNSIRNVHLTRTEFAEALGMKPNSLFVRNMFLLVDKGKDGFVSFEEFTNMFVTMSQGTSEEKAKLIFNMYDVNRDGKLSRKEFDKMLRSMMDLADAVVDSGKVADLMQSMFDKANIGHKDSMTFEDFKRVFASDDHGDILQSATLGLDVEGASKLARPNESALSRRKTFMNRYRESSTAEGLSRQQSKVRFHAKKKMQPTTKNAQRLYAFTRYFENYRLQIFWGTLYTLIVAGIFIERAYYYSIEREHGGLRRLAGYGVSVTRGAASSMMFTYASLVVTMSRNTLTFFRETVAHRFIPFDSFHAFHKFIAYMALFFTVMHCVGHGINLYHICTQASTDLNCYFREYFRATHILASFHYWAFTTVTGLTGIILTLIVIVIYVFAQPYGRRHVFTAFWRTHVGGYILLYFFLFLHGAGRLVQDPLWGWFFLGPMVIFVLDKLVSISRNKVEIVVKKAELLPSGVTYLQFKRPLSFDYKSGQWVRIACLGLGESEYHPFTLTSAPHEEHLSLHIRAVGPWTSNIRRIYDANNLARGGSYPKLYLDGPFGEGHQDWYRYPVAVLVGGGIGVTPFASILKDLVAKSSQGVKFPCRKVYFLWVTRTQKHFEWMTDIIRQVESADPNNLVAVHIFITQFKQKFDLRTTMLYICERHFQKIAGQSLFTGLRAVTHFGRPPFYDFLSSLQLEHEGLTQVGVFSCGPPPMTHSVETACAALNKEDGPSFIHHFENF